MGQCVCGDYTAEKKFTGPDGFVYTYGVHESCQNCDSPAEVTITKIPLADFDHWCLDEIEEVPFEQALDEIRIAVLHPRILIEKLTAFAKERGPEYIHSMNPEELIEGLAGFIEDAMNECFREAVRETLKQAKEE